MHGIDAPEKTQLFDQRSRQVVTTMIASKAVHISGNNQHRYDRRSGTVWYDSEDINVVGVIYGMALSIPLEGQGDGTGIRR